MVADGGSRQADGRLDGRGHRRRLFDKDDQPAFAPGGLRRRAGEGPAVGATKEIGSVPALTPRLVFLRGGPNGRMDGSVRKPFRGPDRFKIQDGILRLDVQTFRRLVVASD